MKIVVVVPTYNEAQNIARLLEVCAQEFKKAPQNDFKVLVVDGNSPDGTGKIVLDLKSKYPFAELLLEQKKAGLGAAYIYGFKYAMTEMHADVVMEMDADFQHDPNDIVRMTNEIEKGYDYVIGSRFVSGGSIPKDWALYRKLLSIGGSYFSKIVLGIYNVNDFTSGFKASRVKGFLDRLDLDSVLSGGFAYKIDLLFKMYKLGAKVKEVPIAFGKRDRGDSKMEKNNFADSLRVVIMLRFNENQSFFKFLAVGFIGLFVDTSLFNVLRLTSIGSNYAALISGGLAMLTTFLLNNYWSFNKHKIEGISKKILGALIYVISSSVPILVRSKIVYFAGQNFGDTFLISNIAFFIGIIFGLVWNFTVYSKIIWKKTNQ